MSRLNILQISSTLNIAMNNTSSNANIWVGFIIMFLICSVILSIRVYNVYKEQAERQENIKSMREVYERKAEKEYKKVSISKDK